MIRNIKIQRFITQLLCVLIISVNLQGLAVAGIVTTEDLQRSEQAEQTRDAIKNLITHSDVRDSLIEHGVSSDQVMERINSMSDSELVTVQGKLDQLPAGQGALEVVLVIFLVLIILDLTGVTDIFPRI